MLTADKTLANGQRLQTTRTIFDFPDEAGRKSLGKNY